MLRSVITRGALAPITVTVVVLGTVLSVAPPATATAQSCRDRTVSPTVEEQRLIGRPGSDTRTMGTQILSASGFDWVTFSFEKALCASRNFHAALVAVHRHAVGLWKLATERTGRPTARAGLLPGDDDRPLYWARLRMTLALRQFDPSRFWLEPWMRSVLEDQLEFGSRGMLTTAFSPRSRAIRVFVTGFDPFILDVEPRRSNPSGAAALSLDGRRVMTPMGLVEFQAVVFPVRFADFDQGMVEKVLTPVLSGSRRTQRADLFATVSQGRPGAFDLEVHNGRRRSTTTPDNLNVWGGGSGDVPIGFPGIPAGPEFVPTTLPLPAMMAANNSPFPVRINTSVTEIPAGQVEPVQRPNGPTAGSTAVNGGGGGYLSNEIAYRATFLRDRLSPDTPGGHIHTPTLPYPRDTALMTDEALERARTSIAAQVRLLLLLDATRTV